MADLGDAGEALRYLAGFWAFCFSPKYRAAAAQRWSAATLGGRAIMFMEGTVATLFGLGLPLWLGWLLLSGEW